MGEILVAVVLGVGSGLLIAWWLSKAAGLKNQAELDAMLADADRERKALLDAAELEAETLRAEAARQNEQLVKEKRAEFTRRERELEAAKRSLDTAQSKLESDKQTLKRRRDTLEREVAETSAALKEANAKLSEAEAERERISGLTRDEAWQSSVASSKVGLGHWLQSKSKKSRARFRKRPMSGPERSSLRRFSGWPVALWPRKPSRW